MPLFSPEAGGTGSAGRLSSVMMRLIEAIISSIDGSEGNLALSGIAANQWG
jgi:GTP-sensing pleiotropic transcriptional regulator CodY